MTDVKDAQIQAHHSSLALHRRCPMAWYFKYGLKLRQAESEIAPERDFGSWWAVVRAADALERGRSLDSLKQKPETLKTPGGTKFSMKTVTVAEVLEVAGYWWETHQNKATEGRFAGDLWEEKLGVADLRDGLAKLYTRHRDAWTEEIKNEHPLGVEVFWKRELPKPKNDPWQAEYPNMNLIGFIDQVYWDAERGMVVVKDDKTTKKLDAASSVEDMMDSQLQLYAWGATPLVHSWTGQKIRAVEYDRARSVAPKPPSLTNAGKLRTYKGEPTTGMTDLQTYLDWVASKPEYPGTKKDGSGAGIYEAEENVIEKLSLPSAKSAWFQKSRVPLNLTLVRAHLRAAVDSSLDIYKTQERAKATGEAARNLTKSCSWCDFAKLCRASMIGGPEGEYDLAEHGLVGKGGANLLVDGELK